MPAAVVVAAEPEPEAPAVAPAPVTVVGKNSDEIQEDWQEAYEEVSSFVPFP